MSEFPGVDLGVELCNHDGMTDKLQKIQVGSHELSTMVDFGALPQEKLELLKRTFCAGTTNDQFQLFLNVCTVRRLNPFAREIYAVVRNTKAGPVMSIQTGIDGFYSIAQESPEYDSHQTFWCGEDGEWKETWGEGYPFAARCNAWLKNRTRPVTAVAHWSEYAQYFKNGKTGQTYLGEMWSKYPRRMIEKCAEALALRKAFPRRLGGIHVPEEFNESVRESVIEAPPDTSVEEVENIEGRMAECETVEGLNSLAAECSKFKGGNRTRIIAAYRENLKRLEG